MDPRFKAILNTLPAKQPRSHLEPYRELILEMRKQSRSYREIVQVLKTACGLTVGTSTVNDFVLAHAKSTAKRTMPSTTELSTTNKARRALIGHRGTYKDKQGIEGTVSAPKALEGIARTLKAIKDQPPRILKKKVLFEYNSDEPLRLQRNQKSKE